MSAVEAQLAEMSNSSTQTAEDIRMLCSAGVKVEHALDAVVSDAQASDVFWDYYSEDEELKEGRWGGGERVGRSALAHAGP